MSAPIRLHSPRGGAGRRNRRLAAAAAACALFAASAAPAADLPAKLSETGLFADIATKRIADEFVSFTPQYALWSDGAVKRRWISLPPGTFIDASDPDAWVFPVGTRLFKEFTFGRRVETRAIDRTADGWRYATYRWLPDESDALLSPEFGERAVYEIAPGVQYDLPGRYDCRACHEGNVSRVLGFTALQLSSDRDPNAVRAEPLHPGDIDLAELVKRGWVRGLPAELVATPPRIAARSPLERAALGYLVGNCANCHNDRGPLADLGFSLEVRVGGTPPGSLPPGALATAVGHVARFQPSGEAPAMRLAPGHPEASVVVRRISHRDPITQMPPLGSKIVDRQALEMLERWIRDQLASAPSGGETGVASLQEKR